MIYVGVAPMSVRVRRRRVPAEGREKADRKIDLFERIVVADTRIDLDPAQPAGIDAMRCQATRQRRYH